MNPTDSFPWPKPDPRAQAQRLLLAARTAISLLESMHALFWELYPDEILAITEHEQQRVIEHLAMALVDRAWPPE